jgi:hypothetical protein
MTTKPHFDLDPSVAFTILLKVHPTFAATPVAEGDEIQRAFLAAWYEDPSLDMFEFAKRWCAQHAIDPNGSLSEPVSVRGDTMFYAADENLPANERRPLTATDRYLLGELAPIIEADIAKEFGA